MKNSSRWTKLWKAIVKWWKNEPLPEPMPLPPQEVLDNARSFLREYDELYSKRTKIDVPSSPKGFHMSSANYSAQAAEAVLREGHKRSTGIESEIRVLALTVERLLGHLELDAERNRSNYNDREV
jgi:hypothetical protein